MTRTTYTRLALLLIAAVALALAGCGGDDDGLSAEDMARIAAAEQAAADAQEAAEAAEAATMDEEEMEEPGYRPSDPGGTQEGQVERAAAKRIADSTMGGMIQGGVSIKSLEQARLGQPARLTIAATGNSDLDSAVDGVMLPANAEIPDWMGVAMEKEGVGGITQRALIYSDAERSVRAFGDVYRYNVDIGNMDPSELASEEARTHLRIGELTDAAQTYAEFDSRVSLVHGLTTTTATRLDISTGGTLRGSYDGVPGQYVCVEGATAGGICRVTLDPNGAVMLEYETELASLIFKADDPDTLLPDRDYLAFGIWEVVPTNPTYANPGQTRPFVKASAPAFNASEIIALRGSATYEGAAVGHWALRSAGNHEATHGRFTAKAMINASFDTTGSGPVVTENTVGSTTTFSVSYATSPAAVFSDSKIYDFMDIDGDMDMSGWLVNLVGPDMINNSVATRATYAAQADATAAIPSVAMPGTTISGTTTGSTGSTTGSMAWEGVWDASLHGTNHATTPTGIVGRFQAESGTPRPITTPEARIDLFGDEGFAGVVGSFAGR